MDQIRAYQKEKYLYVSFEVTKRLDHAGFNMETPAHMITWGQIAKELSHILVDHGIEPDEVTDEIIIDLIEEVKETLNNDDILQWRENIRIRITSLEGVFPESLEPDESVLTEQNENAARLGDEDGYWVDGGASADFFDD